MSKLILEKQINVPDNIATGAAMRAKRQAKGLSLRALAIRLGLSAPFVSDLELGRKNWTEDRAAHFLAEINRK